MKPDTVARRYARALFGLAEQEGTTDAVATGLARAAELLQDATLASVLTGPLAPERKRGLLSEIAAGAPAALRDFLLLLADRDRLRHLGGIRAVFDALVDRRRGRTHATVRTAAPISEEVLAEIARVFGAAIGKEVMANVTVELDLIAGIVVEVEGRVYDGSLRTQLGKLHRQMATGS